MKDCRRTLLDEFVKLSKDWDNNNMLYNSLMFSKLYPGDVENSVADASLMPKQSDEKMRNDIMTSWWTPTKIFLLGNKKELMQKSRKELEEVLLERIPMGKDEEQLRESLSKIRHEKTGEKIEKRRYRCIYGVPWISLCRGQYDKCSGDIQGWCLG